MRRFYPFWFPFCALWGYLIAKFPPDVAELSFTLPGAFRVFFVCCVVFGALLVAVLLLTSATPDSARLHVDLKPWDEPLGVFQFVFVTLIFAGFWGIVLAYVVPSGRSTIGLFMLSMSGGGLVGTLLASHVYRRLKK